MIDLALLENGTFVQKIIALDEIEKSGDPSATLPLIALLGKEGQDDSVRQALSDTIRALLAKNTSQIAPILADPASPALKIAVQLVGLLRLEAARGALAALIPALEGDMLVEAIFSLGHISDASALEIFRRYATSADPFVASASIRQLGRLGDFASVPMLREMLGAAESDAAYEVCSLSTASVVEALTTLGEGEAQAALIEKIHHRNPTVRRLIHATMIERGEKVVEPIAKFFDAGDNDEKVMAAFLLGQIKAPKGAELILSAFDKGKLNDPNVRFSVYDAFGNMPSLKTMICLVDGLNESDEMTLVAVASSLNRMVNPGVAAKISGVLTQGGPTGERVARAIIAAQATELFKAAYAVAPAAKALGDQLELSRDPAIRETFLATLGEIGGEAANADIARLTAKVEEAQKKRILAVDDSRSILMFYRAMLSDMGFEVVTAENGKLALDVLESDPAFDLVITDMNMPEMNGIELTRKVRESMFTETIPVVMATTESDKSQIELADHAGVTGYLVKPIKPDSLKATLDKMLG